MAASNNRYLMARCLALALTVGTSCRQADRLECEPNRFRARSLGTWDPDSFAVVDIYGNAWLVSANGPPHSCRRLPPKNSFIAGTSDYAVLVGSDETRLMAVSRHGQWDLPVDSPSLRVAASNDKAIWWSSDRVRWRTMPLRVFVGTNPVSPRPSIGVYGSCAVIAAEKGEWGYEIRLWRLDGEAPRSSAPSWSPSAIDAFLEGGGRLVALGVPSGVAGRNRLLWEGDV